MFLKEKNSNKTNYQIKSYGIIEPHEFGPHYIHGKNFTLVIFNY